jgi:hypothetical protein
VRTKIVLVEHPERVGGAGVPKKLAYIRRDELRLPVEDDDRTGRREKRNTSTPALPDSAAVSRALTAAVPQLRRHPDGLVRYRGPDPG